MVGMLPVPILQIAEEKLDLACSHSGTQWLEMNFHPWPSFCCLLKENQRSGAAFSRMADCLTAHSDAHLLFQHPLTPKPALSDTTALATWGCLNLNKLKWKKMNSLPMVTWATFQMLSGHVWLVAPVLRSTDTQHSYCCRKSYWTGLHAFPDPQGTFAT